MCWRISIVFFFSLVGPFVGLRVDAMWLLVNTAANCTMCFCVRYMGLGWTLSHSAVMCTCVFVCTCVGCWVGIDVLFFCLVYYVENPNQHIIIKKELSISVYWKVICIWLIHKSTVLYNLLDYFHSDFFFSEFLRSAEILPSSFNSFLLELHHNHNQNNPTSQGRWLATCSKVSTF